MREQRFSWPVRVYFEDTDSGRVVYYANYLKFMERARSEWLRHLGFEQDRLARNERILFAVRQVTLDFLKPARFNERLAVNVALLKCGLASLRLAQSVVNGAGEEICTGTVKIACVDAESFRPKPIPPSILAELTNGD